MCMKKTYAYPKHILIGAPILAAIIYLGIVIASLPHDVATIVCGTIGSSAAAWIMFWYLKLVEKVANGKLMFLNGRFVSVDD